MWKVARESSKDRTGIIYAIKERKRGREVALFYSPKTAPNTAISLLIIYFLPAIYHH